ncbi:MAG: ATP-binding protein [Cyanobacteria bacterium P01_D01_bin.115]
MAPINRIFNYRRSPLPVKIALPFIFLFLALWTTGTFVLGEYFANVLDRKQREKAIDLASLVERDLEQKMQSLRRDARLLAVEPVITRHTAEGDRQALQKKLLPLKPILDADVIQILDTDRQVLLDTRTNAARSADLEGDVLLNLLLTGSDFSTVVTGGDDASPIMVGTSPIKTQQGVVGGVVLGIALSDELLTQINRDIIEEILLLSDGQVVASTSEPSPQTLQWIESFYHDDHAATQLQQNNDYLTKVFSLDGADGAHFDVALLISQKPVQQAQRALWLVIVGISSLGLGLAAIAGYWLARKIAKPVQAITDTAKQVVEQENFSLQAPADREDEIGALAEALNQLIAWVGQYTHDLELAGQTLEAKVESRTAELTSTLAELQEAQSQLIQTEKMSSLGQMVAGIAHEINNPINFIQGNITPLKDYIRDLRDLLDTYQSEYPEPTQGVLAKQEEIDLEFVLEDSSKVLQSMKMGTQRVQDIVVSLRNYSRLDEAVIKDVDIHEGVESTLLILSHRLKYDVEVIKEYGSLPLVRCSPAQLNQVFTNIIANALDAMFDHDSAPKQLTIATRAFASDQVQVSIRDTGPGMTPEVKNKIFNPFFTTKVVGKGTGLGLGICFKIIEHHRGRIEVNSQVEEGTEFLITLPIEALPADVEGMAKTDATSAFAS